MSSQSHFSQELLTASSTENLEDITDFKRVLKSFSNAMPLRETPDLEKHWEYLYERSIGCVGIVKDWLTQQPLLHLCPHCGETIYHLSWNSKLGFCCRCHNWLGISCRLYPSQLITDSDWQWQFFVGQQIGDILANAPYLMQIPQKQKLANAIDLCIVSYFQGKAKIFADLMFLSPTVPSDWRSGRALPVLNLLLRVCYRLSISLLDFLTGNVTISPQFVLKELPLCQQYYKTNRPFDLIQIKELLETALSEFPPKSLRQVASAIKYDRTDLYRYLPDLCHQINLRYKLYKKSTSHFHV